jgi:hypothetical protein
MKKNIIIITFLALASISQLSAQMTDRLVPHFGYMYSLINMENSDDRTQTVSLAFNALSIGSYYTLKQAKDIVSVGIDPNINVGFNFSSAGRLNWYTQMPVFVMGRLGANSTSYNTQKIGIGAGIGLIGSYMSFREPSLFVEVKELYFNPAAVIEGTINSRGSNITGRLQFSLADAKGTGDLFSVGGTFFTNLLSVGIIYGF